MLLHISNYYDADRRSAIADADLTLGAVHFIDGTGADRKAHPVTDSDAAKLVAGNYGVSFKVSTDPEQVTSTDVPIEIAGSRIVAIKSGDQMVDVRKGAILEYDVSLLHNSLVTAGAFNGGIGDALAIKGGVFCKATGVSGAITTPVIARVYNIVNGKPRIELV